MSNPPTPDELRAWREARGYLSTFAPTAAGRLLDAYEALQEECERLRSLLGDVAQQFYGRDTMSSDRQLMAKVVAAEVSSFVTNKAIQIYGGYGYVNEYPLERYLRDAKITELYEGTSEMQRMTIARHLIREG